MAKLVYLGSGSFADPDSGTVWEGAGDTQTVNKDVVDRLTESHPGLFAEEGSSEAKRAAEEPEEVAPATSTEVAEAENEEEVE